MMGLGQIGPPNPQSKDDDYSMMHGLSHAIEVLCEPTEVQAEDMDEIQNKGRIICLTSVKRSGLIHSITPVWWRQNNFKQSGKKNCPERCFAEFLT